ncbi:MAG: hypothetical protein WCS43_01055 [Verrucomicrobiota bacterium]
MMLDKKEALQMTIKAINGKECLFLECGGSIPPIQKAGKRR